MKLEKFDNLIEEIKTKYLVDIHQVTDKDGGSKVYEIPGYEGTIAGYCAKYIKGEEPKVKKDFKLK